VENRNLGPCVRGERDGFDGAECADGSVGAAGAVEGAVEGACDEIYVE
jgi:hypothetical protein